MLEPAGRSSTRPSGTTCSAGRHATAPAGCRRCSSPCCCVAPETIGALNAGDLRVAPLAPPPVHPTPRRPWRSLRERSAGWIPITFPLRHDADGTLLLSELPDLRGGFDPELAISLLDPLAAAARRRPNSDRLRDVAAPERRRRPLTSCARRLASSLQLEPGVRAGFGYDGGARHVERRRSRRGQARRRPTRRRCSIRRDATGGLPDLIFGPPYDTRVVVRDLERSSCACASWASRASRSSAAPTASASCSPTAGCARSARPARALREGLRFDVDLDGAADRGHRLQLRRRGRAQPRARTSTRRSASRCSSCRLHSILRQRPDPRRPGPLRHPRRGAAPHWSATVGPVTLVMDGAGGWVGWWADEPGGDKQCVGLLPPTGVGLLARPARASPAAASSTSPAGPTTATAACSPSPSGRRRACRAGP